MYVPIIHSCKRHGAPCIKSSPAPSIAPHGALPCTLPFTPLGPIVRVLGQQNRGGSLGVASTPSQQLGCAPHPDHSPCTAPHRTCSGTPANRAL
mmetsp:Transcript_9601/g.20464  ORF Transcript_9601/g.20464 Transcript_9601/m.20464 type:complete len:94 (-) Transcript_9601:715-996(-)